VIEKLRKFELADAPFSVENNQMTPTLKIRRPWIREMYQERLDRLY
jgi:long-chain acyl-CoA synthetase